MKNSSNLVNNNLVIYKDDVKIIGDKTRMTLYFVYVTQRGDGWLLSTVVLLARYNFNHLN